MCDLDQGLQVLASRQGIGQSVPDSSHQVDCCQPILVLLDSITLHFITNTFSEPILDLIFLIVRCWYPHEDLQLLFAHHQSSDYEHNGSYPVQLAKVFTLSAERGHLWSILSSLTNFVKPFGESVMWTLLTIKQELTLKFIVKHCFEST